MSGGGLTPGSTVRLSIITPCSRPENLEAVRDSVIIAANPISNLQLRWLVVFDATSVVIPACLAYSGFEIQASLIPSVNGEGR